MQAAALDPEEDVAGAHAAAVEDAVERHGSDGGRHEVEAAAPGLPANHLADLCQLATGTAHARELAASSDPFAERPEQLCIDLLDGEVVDKGDGSGANAQNVVDVHGDAIDADGVVAAGGLRHQKLGADPVGRDGDSEVLRHRHDVGEVADVENRTVRFAGVRERRPDETEQGAEPAPDRSHPDGILTQGPGHTFLSQVGPAP